ncbi:MAG: DUF721 domain-containing protein [Bacillota bacterium]|nr:DUF721 domain-containing protein [Bacillota bacterium]
MTEQHPPAELRTVLAELLRRLGMTGRLQAYRALDLWPEVVGPGLARHSRAAGVEGGVLRVLAENGSWATELAFHKSSILRELHRRGLRGVRALRIEAGPGTWAPDEAPAPQEQGGAFHEAETEALLPAAAAALEELERSGVDAELLERWRRLMEAQARRRARMAHRAAAGEEGRRPAGDSGLGRRGGGTGP